MKIRWGHVLSNVLWGAYFVLFVRAHIDKLASLSGAWKAVELMLITQGVLLGFFFVFRRAAQFTSWKPWHVIIAFMGSFGPTLFYTQKAVGDPNLFGLTFQIIGSILSFAAFFSLGRSWGMLPANRSIQTGGMYRWVRHPVYATYQIFNAGYLMNQPTLYNCAVALFCLLSQVMRIFAEENVLQKDPDYRKYAKKVRWRLFPGIF